MNQKLKSIKLQPVRYFKSLIEGDSQGIDLTVGEGHFSSPFASKLKAYEALLTDNTKYSTVEGDIKLREMITSKFYPNYDKNNEIIITNGATQGLYITLHAIIDSIVDEIIIIGPYYPAYYNNIRLLGAKPVIIDSSQTNFKINCEVLDKYINDNTKAIIINEPNNPTGITYSLDEKKALIDYFIHKDIYIVIDEVYKIFTDSNYVSFADLISDSLKDKFIFINSLSKSHMMTGYRVGFVLSNEEFNYELKKLNYLSVSSISTIMQEAAVGALSDDYFCDFVSKYYLNNLRIIQDELDFYDIDYVKSSCGYYIFINTLNFNLTGVEFCNFFSKNYHIALVPGYIFGDDYKYYVRASCCKDIKEIVKFIEAIIDFSTKKGEKT